MPDRPQLPERKLGPWSLPAVGLGCMNLSHAYGTPPPPERGRSVLETALDHGVRHFDTAALYGFGRNEELVGPVLKAHRDRVILATKCGLRGENGVRSIGGKPGKLQEDLDNSLRRLQTEVIDLYYLHRLDPDTPVEESVGQMSRFVEQGKVREIGLSEMSAETIRKAHRVHPIAAVQSEYSLWSRNVEISVLSTCRELGIAFVAFSPLARGFFADSDLDPDGFVPGDLRRGMPRFQSPNFSANVLLLEELRRIASEQQCTTSQLALAWVLHQAPCIHVIPGTTSPAHLVENLGAAGVEIGDELSRLLGALVNQNTVRGSRYSVTAQADIDTEEFEPV